MNLTEKITRKLRSYRGFSLFHRSKSLECTRRYYAWRGFCPHTASNLNWIHEESTGNVYVEVKGKCPTRGKIKA